MIRVVAIDDHPLILQAITEELAKCPEIELLGTADSGLTLFDLVDEKSPDVVILDLGLDRGKFDPIMAVRKLLESHPHLRILILTGDNNPSYMRMLTAAGAKGYVLKSDDLSLALPEGVQTVYAGQLYYSKEVLETLLSREESSRRLSDREIQVLRLVAEGLQNTSIAEILSISEHRVRNILSSIYDKLELQENGGEVNPRVALVNKARKKGLLLK